MFFKKPTPEYKEDSPVDIANFLRSGEYDQGDKAICAYDDISNLLHDEKFRQEILKKLA